MIRTERQAFVFLAPFLIAYGLFLFYPMLKGFWISLHDWHLLRVAMNPDAVEFVGFRNYERILWGRDMEWSAVQKPWWQGGLVALAALLAYRGAKHAHDRTLYWFLAAVALVAAFVIGWAPGEDGRWYNRQFWPRVGNTLFLVAWIVPLVTAVALVLAVLLNRQTLAAAVFRTIFFVSTVLSVTVVTLIWKLALSPNQGLVSGIFERFGLEPIAWLTTEGFADAGIIMATVWWGTGISMMLFLAALQDISDEIYDAARLDDIGPVRTFFYITLPNLRHAIVLVMVLAVIAHFQIFGQVRLMTDGGPVETTESLVVLIYDTGFQENKLGRATAMSTVLLMFITLFSILQVLIVRGQRD
ncbi:sugar ABC transporter permease [Rhodophyticola sp. CCM32]|uniref:carbohydrate ABC transporter permease n=1 Tax=Rhodophyticola sp. CCM32 TaxID=2916397 RepID=UPI00107F9925|nr:sugar ABC transporter permease [Rhodophyticola sp. CCM32]QBY00799.1 sugar ABC transporter permease [Rhodophyticola sp. CCM32]